MLVVGMGVGACAGSSRPEQPERVAVAGTISTTSNVLRADYAGTESCAPCHAELVERVRSSPMHRMTRPAEGDAIRASFDGAEFRFMGHVATMERHGERPYVRLRTPDGGESLHRVTKVIGGRTREDYVGVLVNGPGPKAFSIGKEMILPISYELARGEWRYKGYSVMVPERPAMRPGPVWSETCIFCHNTPPGLPRLYGELLGPTARTYQGSTLGSHLPSERRLAFTVRDPRGLARMVREEASRLGSPPSGDLPSVLEGAIERTRRGFDADHLVELGIGCEACHGGSREHVLDPRIRPSYLPVSQAFEVHRADARAISSAEAINRSCAQCHSVLFSRYPHTWEGGHRRQGAGGSHINSGEGRDFLLGGCASAMACTSCHDAHAQDDPDALRAIEGRSGNALCTSCHTELRSDAALRAHAHHDPGGEGAACVGCHMARKNMGLDHRLTRYHRIGSPTEPERVLGDRPLECALCHRDGSVEGLVGTMERWWGRRYDRRALRRLYGEDLSVNVLEATLRRGKPHEQAVAIALAGESRDADALDELVAMLDHEVPLLRFFVRASLEEIAREPFPVDMNLPGDALKREGERWLEKRSVRAP